MGIVRSVFWGSVAWFSATAMMVHPEMALGLAIVVAFLSESAHHSAQLSRVRRDGTARLNSAKQTTRWRAAGATRRHVELNTAIEELQRRDAWAVRGAGVVKRQKKAMTAAPTHSRRAGTKRRGVDSMERLLNMQVEQVANMQQAMGNLLQH